MSIDSPLPLEQPVRSPTLDGRADFKTFDPADRGLWQSLSSLRQDTQSLMQGLGLSDFFLDDRSSSKPKKALNPDDAGAKLDAAVPAKSTDRSGAVAQSTSVVPSERSQPGESAGRGAVGPAPEWVKPVTSPTPPESAPSSSADAPKTSKKPPPLPELVDPVTQPRPAAGAPQDARARGTDGSHWEAPPPPVDWVKPVEARPVTVEAARQSLERSAEAKLSPSDAIEFRANMQKFEARAKTDHLSASQISLTYQNIDQLLNAKDGPVDSADRQHLAEQVIALAADPNKAVTGTESQTCGPVQLETLIYKNSPEKAANLVAQVAMSGSYTAADGTKVTPETLPTEQSRNPADQYSRLYASQIFQTTALDVALKREGSDLEYHHEIGDRETTQNAEYFIDKNGKRQSYEGTYPADLLYAYQGITGKNDLTVISDAREPDTDNVKHVHSAAQLKSVLDRLHAKGDPPTIIGVDTRNQPFWDQNHVDYPQGNEDPDGSYGHWAAIKGYDPKTGTISYHNGWDSPDHKIDIQGMYRATQWVDSNLPSMGKDFVASLSSGRGNYAEAIDALRIRSETGRISDHDLNRLLDRDVQGLISERGAHFMDDRTDRRNIGELVNYLANRHKLSLSPETKRVLDQWWDAHPNQ